MTGPTVRFARVTLHKTALRVLRCALALSVSASAKHPTIITLDPPGSVNTNSAAINPAGAIAGYFFDANNWAHGFLRARDGTFTTFDAPGAVSTLALDINPEGAIAGPYLDHGNVWHLFLRALDGTFTEFDAPGAGTGTGTAGDGDWIASSLLICFLLGALCVSSMRGSKR